MDQLDQDFFAEYKRLEKLCSEMYSDRNGVSRYIDDMISMSDQGKILIDSWENDLNDLKHIRWLRNRIAHEDDPDQICNKTDLTFATDFHERIYSGNDPLTLLNRLKKEKLRDTEIQESHVNKQKDEQSSPGKAEADRNTLLAIALLILMLLSFLFKR